MLIDTGERVVPEFMKPINRLLLEHVARYDFAIHYSNGRLLDIACGVGYGAQMIAKAAKSRLNEIVAVDLSEETIEYARGRYHHPLISYRVYNAEDKQLPEQLGLFDTIVSFETLEHLPNDRQFLSNLYSMLKPGGQLILSTPFGEGRGKPCGSPFHVHQLKIEEFQSLFAQYKETEFYFQRGSLIEPQRKNIEYPVGIAVCTK
ncbi:methyltransferase domain-containing protein [Bacillus tianshenii]|nr:methyltransferase domain-containing protein [Bacillus tianshenii]